MLPGATPPMEHEYPAVLLHACTAQPPKLIEKAGAHKNVQTTKIHFTKKRELGFPVLSDVCAIFGPMSNGYMHGFGCVNGIASYIQ